MNIKRVFVQIFFVLSIFSLFRLILYLMYIRTIFNLLSIIDLFIAFIHGIRFDLSISMTFLALPIVMLSLPHKIFNTKYWYYLWISIFYIISIGLFLILAIDVFYFSYVNRHLGHELMFIFNDLNFIIDILYGPYIIAIIIFFFFSFLFIFISQKLDCILKNKYQNIPITMMRYIHFVLICIFLFISIRGSFSQISINVVDAFIDNNYEKAQLTLNGAFTVAHTLRTANYNEYSFLKTEEVFQILKTNNIISSVDYPFYKQIQDSINIGKVNIVIILLESWFNYFLYPYHQRDDFKNLTPYFSNVLYPNSVVFQNFVANGLRSIDAIQHILTSFPSIKGAPNLSRGLELMNISNIASIANMLGYDTFFFQSANRRSFRLDSVASLLGFKYYFGQENYPRILVYHESPPTFGWDYETFSFMLKTLNQAQNNFFAMVFTGTAHTPFRQTPKPYHNKHTEYGVEGFLNTLHYVDFCLEDFFSAAEKTSWFANTVFIITGDHTVAKYANLKDLDLYKVPLIIYAPKLLQPKIYTKITSHIDILPTVVDLLNFDSPVAAIGTSIFEQNNDTAFALLTSKENPTPILVTSQGFIQHSFKNVIKYQKFDQQKCDELCLQNMEKILLSLHQILYEVINRNQWKP